MARFCDKSMSTTFRTPRKKAHHTVRQCAMAAAMAATEGQQQLQQQAIRQAVTDVIAPGLLCCRASTSRPGARPPKRLGVFHIIPFWERGSKRRSLLLTSAMDSARRAHPRRSGFRSLSMWRRAWRCASRPNGPAPHWKILPEFVPSLFSKSGRTPCSRTRSPWGQRSTGDTLPDDVGLHWWWASVTGARLPKASHTNVAVAVMVFMMKLLFWGPMVL